MLRRRHSPQSGSFARLVVSALVFAGLVLAAGTAAAQPAGVNHRRGQAALDRLGDRLPAVAARHNMAAARLRELFLADPYLAVDETDNLLFIDEFVPEQAESAAAASIGTGGGALTLADTFLLHSLPGAAKVIYLDFNGHTTSGTVWNSSYGDPIVSAPFSLDGDPAFSATEQERIQYIWQRVAEDFLPYGVDVTTQDPGIEGLRKSGAGDVAWGQRVVISPTNWYNTGAGGVAYVGAFNWSSDTPCFVFTAQLGGGNEKYTAEAATHEAGHTVGLYHDGVTGGSAYYSGQNGWAPIMGVGYYQTIVQWSRGEYPNANNTEDDLSIMTGYGFTFRPDDHADTAAAATPLVVSNATAVSGSGIIERPTDKDQFSFLTGAGTITLNVTSPARSTNLDIKAELFDSSGVSVATADPSTSLSANISLYVAAGAYTLVVEGVGNGDLATGYPDYGSLGEYSIAGTIIDPGVARPPVAAASATPTSGNAPLPVQFSGAGSYDPDGQIRSYAWAFGDGGIAATGDATHTYADKGSYTAVLTVTDDKGWTGSASVTITVAGAPTAPANLGATAMSASQINLAWLDQSNDESGFVIERSIGGGSWSPIATVGMNVQSYANPGLAADTSYQYRVKAFNGAGESGYTNTASATTQAPLAMHVGDLDGTRSVVKKSWSAKVTVTVHDASHKIVPGAVVSGTWSSGGAGSCTTGTKGTCTLGASGIPLTTTFTTFSVTGIVKSGSTYTAAANHDPELDSTGTSITIAK
jgi:PKD repeat protein